MASPGLLIGGRYRLAGRIGAGGMGEVWQATDQVLGRAVAVKLLGSARGSEQDRARFRAEARHAGSLSHPGIARVYDYRDEDWPSQACLVMELVDGPSLARLLDEGPVDPARTMDLIAQAAAALQAAHAAGLVHRDIKPGNLLVSPDGHVKITDFGIARAAGSVAVTSPGTLIGTPAYMAPERAAGAPATPAADLYALGIVTYQCLTGRLPFQGEPLAVALAHLEQPVPPLPPWVPAGVAALVADLTAKDPRARPASAGQVAERAAQLRDALTSRNALTSTATRPLPGSRGNISTSRRGRPGRRIFAGLNAGAAVAVIAAAGWGIASGHGPGHPQPSATHRPGPAASHRPHRAAAARQISGGTAADAPSPARHPAASPKPPTSHTAAAPTPDRTPTATPTTSGTPTSTGTPSPSGTPTPSGTSTAAPSPSLTTEIAPAGTGDGLAMAAVLPVPAGELLVELAEYACGSSHQTLEKHGLVRIRRVLSPDCPVVVRSPPMRSRHAPLRRSPLITSASRPKLVSASPGAQARRRYRSEEIMQQAKIAVAGATGRLGRHVTDVLRAAGREVVPISRSAGVDVITGDGLDDAVKGTGVIIDVTGGQSPEQRAATEFFNTAARNLQRAGVRVGVTRYVVVSIIGIQKSAGGYGAAKLAHELAVLAGPVAARVLRVAQFHELVGVLMEMGRQGEVIYLPQMRTQIIAARTVAEELAEMATSPEAEFAAARAAESAGAPVPELAGPREENLASLARLVAARRGDQVRIEEVKADDPDSQAAADGSLLPGPHAKLAGPTFEQWLTKPQDPRWSQPVPQPGRKPDE
ncbi:MAG: protein kinase [Streptosporangiaceae bacterium]|nr:protein kinase [Streptosporangiaceae bacterium]